MNSFGGGGFGGAVTVQLQRQDGSVPWGFRLQGGTDFRQQLCVKKVSRSTPAEGALTAGDAILSIGNYDAKDLTHTQASQLIKQAGNVLQLTLTKGTFAAPIAKPTGPVKFSAGRATGLGY